MRAPGVPPQRFGQVPALPSPDAPRGGELAAYPVVAVLRAAGAVDRVSSGPVYFFLSTNQGMMWSKVTTLPTPVATMKLMP